MKRPNKKTKVDFDYRHIWRAFPDTFATRASNWKWVRYKWIEHLTAQIYNSLISGGGRYVIEAPPQHGKSSFMSNWLPAWYIETFPERRVIFTTYAQEYASRWGVIARSQFQENGVFKTKLRDDLATKKEFVTEAGGGMVLTGIGGAVTGRSADLLIIDDPVKNHEEALSKTISERNHDWYKTVAETRLQEKATVIVLMTRWADDDLGGRLITEHGFKELRYPAIAEDDDIIGRKPGEALCPDRFSIETLLDKKNQLRSWFDAMYQGRPVPKSGNIIKGHEIKFYNTSPQFDDVAIFADLAFKDGEENDYTVIEAWGRVGPDIYLIDQKRGHMSFPNQVKAFKDLCEKYPDAFHKEIEDKANGSALIQTVKNEIPGLIAFNPRTDKTARLNAVSSLYESGNVYYPNPENHPWVITNIEELTRFPKAKHDDTVDCASMALRHFGKFNSALQRLEALSKRN